jgi:cysteine desulfurase
MIYFDNNSTTKIGEKALHTYIKFSNSIYANASSVYPEGIKSKYNLDKARTDICYILGCENPESFIFTSSATESNNVIINLFKNKNNINIYTSEIEHPSILEPIKNLNCNVIYLKVNKNGLINIENCKDLFSKFKPDFISIQAANNEIGSISANINDIFSLAKQYNEKCLTHTDATQILFKSKNKFTLTNNIDFASFSSHKVYGPKGVGLLYSKDINNLQPYFFGGGQENGIRSGTENVPGICSFVDSCKELNQGYKYYIEKVEKLRNYLYIRIKELKQREGLNLNFNSDINESYIVNTINFSIPYLNASKFLKFMYTNDICISARSACHTSNNTESYVIKAIGKTQEDSENSVRISLGIYNEEYEVNLFMKKFESYIKLRKK